MISDKNESQIYNINFKIFLIAMETIHNTY